MLHRPPLQSTDVSKIWSTILKDKKVFNAQDDASRGKIWHEGLPSGFTIPSGLLKHAYTLLFLRAYILLEDVEKSCLHKGDYKSRDNIKKCDEIRQKIADGQGSKHFKLIDREYCECLLDYIEKELKHWGLLVDTQKIVKT